MKLIVGAIFGVLSVVLGASIAAAIYDRAVEAWCSALETVETAADILGGVERA